MAPPRDRSPSGEALCAAGSTRSASSAWRSRSRRSRTCSPPARTTASCRSPTGREGIEVRSVASGRPGASRPGIRPGDCVLGIGKRLVNSISDASAELRRHRIGETVAYLVRRGPCVMRVERGRRRRGRCERCGVRLSSSGSAERPTSTRRSLGFLFFFIGLFVFKRRPDDRAARIFFLLCVLFLLFFVCRLRPASYWWIDLFVQNTGTVSLFLLPAVFLHFFLIFPRPKRLTFARPDEWTGRAAGALEGASSRTSSRRARGSSTCSTRFRRSSSSTTSSGSSQGHQVSILSGAPLSSWILLGDYLVLGLVALAHSAFTLEDPRERRQAFHVFVGTILGTTPFVLLRHRPPVGSSTSTTTSSTGSSR